MQKPNKFWLYRFECIFGLCVFVSTFVAAVLTKNVVWIVLIGWPISLAGSFHLIRLKCPSCGNKVMRRRVGPFYLSRILYPRTCNQCEFDLTKIT